MSIPGSRSGCARDWQSGSLRPWQTCRASARGWIPLMGSRRESRLKKIAPSPGGDWAPRALQRNVGQNSAAVGGPSSARRGALPIGAARSEEKVGRIDSLFKAGPATDSPPEWRSPRFLRETWPAALKGAANDELAGVLRLVRADVVDRHRRVEALSVGHDPLAKDEGFAVENHDQLALGKHRPLDDQHRDEVGLLPHGV